MLPSQYVPEKSNERGALVSIALHLLQETLVPEQA